MQSYDLECLEPVNFPMSNEIQGSPIDAQNPVEALFSFDYAPIPVVITDAEGRILKANSEFAELIGIPLRFINKENKKPLSVYVPLSFHRILFKTIANRAAGLKQSISVVLRKRSHDYVSCQTSVSWHADKNDDGLYGVWVFHDATVERESENRMLESLASKEVANAHLSQLTQTYEQTLVTCRHNNAEFIHELKTAIQPMLSTVELLLNSTADAKQEELLNLLHTSVLQMQMFTNSALSVARDNAGRLPERHNDFDLRAMIQTTILQFSSAAKAKGIDLTYRVADDLPLFIRGDQIMLGQILFNLVSNAMKYTPSGNVSVEVTSFEGRDSGKILFCVSDTGRGIGDEYIDCLFEPFSDACTFESRQSGGSGLGLFICKRLIELMSGNIAVESTPGHGSKIMFTLPLSGVSDDQHIMSLSQDKQMSIIDFSSEAKSVPSPAVTQQHQHHVLLAEDNDLVAHVLCLQLRRLGCDVMRVENGLEAVQAAGHDNFDMILMDCQMPGLNGYGAAKQIRNLPNCGMDMPIVALTGDSEPDAQERCLSAGMNYFLSKPAGFEQLQSLIASTMSA